MKKFTSIIAAIVMSASCFMANAQMQQLPNDPAVRKGTLENGLTYYIRHNELPAQRAEIYLATNAGAIMETPDQDGLAHFLEHMCFNGTKNFPEKGILDWLQGIGASFGGNVNASTGVDQTQYMLNNIPLVRETVIDTCLLIMHDYSHFVSNDPVEIDKERPVIIEERRTRRNAGWRTFEKSLPVLYGDTKYATCTLIGSEENLKTFKPESLVNFYQTWYYPANQAIIVVGDIDVDEVEAKIKNIWSDVPAAENPKTREPIALVDFDEPRIGIFTDPETTTPSIEVLWVSQAHDEALNSTNVGFSIDMFEDLISTIMSERFNDITSKADSPFIQGGIGFGKLCEAFECSEASAGLKEDNIMGGFQALLNEVEKMKRYGFTEAEVSRAKENILSAYEKAANGASTRKNPEFVRPLINNFFDNRPYMDPATKLEIVKSFLGQINAAVLNQVSSQVIPENNLVVIYSGPEKEGIATPTREQILAAFQNAKNAEIAAPVEESSDVALLDEALLKGSKVKKTGKGIYNATEWTLKNGVKVVVLPTEYKKDQILFNLVKAGGLSLVSDEDMPSFDNSIQKAFHGNQGLSKFKATELSKMLAGKNVAADYYIDGLYNGVSGSSTVKDLETALQLAYLAYTDARFDQEEWDNTVAQLKSVLPNIMSNPQMILQKELSTTLYGDGPRNEFISMEKLEKANLETIEKNYKKLFADAAGAKFIITGDVDLETLKPLVEKYIGSLPAGKKASSWKDVAPHMAKGDIVNSFETDMQTPLTTVVQLYTYYADYNVQNDVLNDAISYILDMVYTETLREEEGGTYGASSAADSRKNPEGRYLMQVAFTCKPAMADKLIALAKKGLQDLADNGPTDDQYNRTMENLKKNLPESRISNSYWLSCIANYMNNGINFDNDKELAIANITKEKIQNMAKALVSSGNYVEVVQRPGKTAEGE